MKKIFAVLLTLVWLILCAGCTGAKELTLSEKCDAESLKTLFLQDEKFQLSGLEWGVSRAEAEKALCFTFTDFEPDERTEGITFAEHPARFLGLSGTMRLAFSNDRLYAVNLIVGEGDRAEQFNALSEDLFAAFGETQNRINADEDINSTMLT